MFNEFVGSRITFFILKFSSYYSFSSIVSLNILGLYKYYEIYSTKPKTLKVKHLNDNVENKDN